MEQTLHTLTHRESIRLKKTSEIIKSNLWVITTLLTRPGVVSSLPSNTSSLFQWLTAISVKQFLLMSKLNDHLLNLSCCWLPGRSGPPSPGYKLLSDGCKVSAAASAVFSPHFHCFVCVTLRPQSIKEGWQNYSKSVLRGLGISISRQSANQNNLSFEIYKRKSVTTAATFVC